MNSRSVLAYTSLLVLSSLASFATAACSSSSTDDGSCHPNDTTCNHAGADGGSSGADGSSQGSDSGSTGNDSGTSTGNDSGHGDAGHESGTGAGDGGGPHDGSADAAGGGFGMSCTQNTDCPSAYPVCFTFNNGTGKHCTKSCQSAADCPNPPNFGCNGMGVCKVQ